MDPQYSKILFRLQKPSGPFWSCVRLKGLGDEANPVSMDVGSTEKAGPLYTVYTVNYLGDRTQVLFTQRHLTIRKMTYY